MIHTVKGFSVINEAEVYFFLEFSCFFFDLVDVGNLISDSSVQTQILHLEVFGSHFAEGLLKGF